MDNPPKFQAIHDEAIAADTPLDAFVQKKLRQQEDWLRRYDGVHMSRRIWTDVGADDEPTTPYRASVPFAQLDQQIIRLTPGVTKLQVDIGCMVSSLENPGTAGVDVELELLGFGKVAGTIAPHTPTTQWYKEELSLEFNEPLQFDGVAVGTLWFKSQFEPAILQSFPIRETTADYGEANQNVFNNYNPAGLYVIEQLDDDGNVTYAYDLYESQGNRIFFAHPMIRVEENDPQDARIRALGFIALAGVDWRLIYDGV